MKKYFDDPVKQEIKIYLYFYNDIFNLWGEYTNIKIQPIKATGKPIEEVIK
jgi:hypothetical protein